MTNVPGTASIALCKGTMAQLVRALAYGAEGPRIEICTEPIMSCYN